MKAYFIKLLSALLLLLFVGARPAAAASAPQVDEPPRIDRAVFDTGLQNSGAILQDRDGFIWIGTDGSGLYRYDGYELKVYKPGGENPFPDATVYALLEDREGLIWILTGSSGLVRYDKNTGAFKQYTSDPQNPRSLSSNVSSIFTIDTLREDAAGLLWVGTQGGLNAFDKRTETFTRYLHDPAQPDSLSHNDVHAVLVDRQDRIWVGTNGGGLDCLDKTTGKFTHYTHNPLDPRGLASDVVYTLLEDRAGALWVGTNKGLQKFDAGAFTSYLHDPANPNSPSSDVILSLYQDNGGLLWITYLHAPNGGVTVFDPGSGNFYRYQHDPDNPYTLGSNSIDSVLEDRAGIVWFVNDVGKVDKLDKNASRFKHYPPASLPRPFISCLYEDRQQTLWISTFQTGLTAYAKDTQTFRPYFDDYHYSAVFEDSEGNFWVGTTLPASLKLLDRESGKILKSFSHDPANPDSLSGDNMQIGAIVEDKFDANILWLSTYGAGLEQFNKATETFRHFPHDPNNPNSPINNISEWALYQDREGIVWLPTIAGLDRFDPRTGSFTHYLHDPSNPDSLLSNSANVVFEDSAGRLWVGTALGFEKLDRATGKFTHYTQATGYPVTMITAFTEDHAGNLWLGSYAGDGIIRFDPRTGVMRAFHTGDGLPSDQYTRGALKDHDGELWFGSTQGLTSFYPNAVGVNAYVPPVKVTALKQGGEPMRLDQAPERVSAIRLDWQHNYFEFEYTALNFTNPANNQFKYKLEGLDKEWYDAGTRRFGRYSGLRGGDYTLRIIASNNDGVWNETGVAIKVTVETSFWEAWWFYPLLGALLCGGSLLAYLYRTRQVRAIRTVAQALRESEERYRRLNVVLEQRVQERTAQLDAANQELMAAIEELLAINQEMDVTNQELVAANQELEAFDYSVSHDLRAPLRRMDSFSQALLEEYGHRIDEAGQGLLQRIRANAQRMDELIDGLLRLSRLTRGELRHAEVDLSALARAITAELRLQEPGRGVEFVIAESAGVYADPRLMRAVLENLLNNAWKFTRRQENARIEFGVLPVENGPAAYFVRDNGAGFDMAYAAKLFVVFQRLHENDEFPGHGIGLATVQRIIRRHGGRVWAEGKVNEGATFYFTLGPPERLTNIAR